MRETGDIDYWLSADRLFDFDGGWSADLESQQDRAGGLDPRAGNTAAALELARALLVTDSDGPAFAAYQAPLAADAMRGDALDDVAPAAPAPDVASPPTIDRLAIAGDDDRGALPAAQPALVPSDPSFGQQWHLQNTGQSGGTAGVDINVTGVWNDFTGAGVTVGIVDDGVERTHPDLVGNYDTSLDYDARSGDDDAQAINDDEHGTSVAGLIGATSNSVGGVGVAYGATITGFRMGFGADGSVAQETALMQRLDTVDVANNSWGYNGFFYDNFESGTFAASGEAVLDAVTNGRGGLGTAILFAAGNDGHLGQNVNYHSYQNSIYTIAVGAVDHNGNASFYSTPGAAVLVSGTTNNSSDGGSSYFGGIYTTDRTGSAGYSSTDYTGSFGGTSAATPIVAGVVALMLEANPVLGYRDIQEILAYSAIQTDAGDGTWIFNGANDWNGGGLHTSQQYGFGLVDAHAAVRLAETWELQHTQANLDTVAAARSPGLAIPDGGTMTDSVVIGTGLTIDHIQVDINISHTWIGDLIVWLTSPDGTDSTLVNRPGVYSGSQFGSSQDNIVFGLTSTEFWGETGAGTWTLHVTDAEASFAGTLNSWTLRLFGDTIDTDDVYVYTDEFGGFTAAGDAARRTLTDTGGTDTLNAAALTDAATIDLTPGANSTIAGNSLSIAAGSVIENVIGGDGGDTITGNDMANTIRGMRGNDQLTGAGGNDRIEGGDGNDVINGGTGDNVLLGGDGNDVMWGVGGADQLFGGAGNDYLEGNGGGDHFDGGEGNDTASFWWSPSAINVNLGTGTASGGFAEGATLVGIENATGSVFDDTLTGDAGANHLLGNAGNDHLIGAGGNDRLEGQGGNDTIDGGSGDNVLLGGDGNDVMWGVGGADQLFGGAGNDYLEGNGGGDHFDGGDGTDTASFWWSPSAISVNLTTGAASGGFAAGATLVGIENATGSAHDDTLTGDAVANHLLGNAGNDHLVGAGGNDRLEGQGGNDTIDGGAGDNVLLGGDGNDVMWGVGGADQLFGGSGNDYLEGNGGGDYFDGGDGNDTASFYWSPSAVTVDLGAGTASGGIADGATLVGIENVSASGHDDDLTGDANANYLMGHAGDDRLTGAGGNDRLDGGIGDDLFVFEDGSGNDVVGDFAAGAGSDDVIDIAAFGFAAFGDVLDAAADVGADVRIQLDADDSVTLIGVNRADLHEDDFTL